MREADAGAGGGCGRTADAGADGTDARCAEGALEERRMRDERQTSGASGRLRRGRIAPNIKNEAALRQPRFSCLHRHLYQLSERIRGGKTRFV